ncbi:hypothetical protein PYCCODRAFT_1438085 [Trametes coccinea BRFM310]|uniref:Uncharacterized protein n=1 Tax=Trametes coccinea (strain BRFM310) TaxID=1353009 RepID=A0A1Y2III9_TRAC3|nr:hypothetical protein PYCCODRAFT_1438085 [Trametes coccinea BRFM310]
MLARANAKIMTISVEDVFEREIQTLDDLRRDILLLTIANADYRIGETHHFKSTMKGVSLSSDEHAKYAVLGHISTLLGARHPQAHGPSALDCNAVSGRIDPHGATIVCSLAETSPSENAETVVRRAVVNADEGKRVLEDWSTIEDPSEDQFVDVHVSQVASILAHAWRLDRSQRMKGELLRNFQLFMIRRARSKILARLDNMINLWGGCPIEIMQDWYKTHPDVVQASTVRFPRLARTASFATLLTEHSLQPLPNRPDDYPISSTNIQSWLEALKDPLTRIVEALGDTTVPPSVQQTKLAHMASYHLFFFLRSNLCQVLQKHGVVEALMDAYGDHDKEAKALKAKKAWKATQGFEIETFQHAQNVDTEEAVREAETVMEAENVDEAGQGWMSLEDSIDREPAYIDEDLDDDASSQPEEDEDAVQHLFRYLQTITAWNTAVVSLMSTRGVLSELNVFILKTFPRIDVTLADIEKPISRYEALLREGLRANYEGAAYGERLGAITARMNDVKRRLRLNEKNVQQGQGTLTWVRDRFRVHAEAALMSLAWSYSEGATQAVDGVDLDTLFPQEGSVIIGVSKKCCWCCHALRQSLEGHLSFVLPGTHAVILPWLPPPGVRESVLVKMREALFGILHARVCKPGSDHPCNPLSPVDDDESSEDVIHSVILRDLDAQDASLSI